MLYHKIVKLLYDSIAISNYYNVIPGDAITYMVTRNSGGFEKDYIHIEKLPDGLTSYLYAADGWIANISPSHSIESKAYDTYLLVRIGLSLLLSYCILSEIYASVPDITSHIVLVLLCAYGLGVTDSPTLVRYSTDHISEKDQSNIPGDIDIWGCSQVMLPASSTDSSDNELELYVSDNESYSDMGIVENVTMQILDANDGDFEIETKVIEYADSDIENETEGVEYADGAIEKETKVVEYDIEIETEGGKYADSDIEKETKVVEYADGAIETETKVVQYDIEIETEGIEIETKVVEYADCDIENETNVVEYAIEKETEGVEYTYSDVKVNESDSDSDIVYTTNLIDDTDRVDTTDVEHVLFDFDFDFEEGEIVDSDFEEGEIVDFEEGEIVDFEEGEIVDQQDTDQNERFVNGWGSVYSSVY